MISRYTDRPGLRLLTVLALFAWTPDAAAQSLAEKGKAIAEQHCVRCHVVDPDSPFSGIGSTPSFQLLVTAFPDWRERFETFYGRLPHPSVIRFEGVAAISEDPPTFTPVQLQLSDVDAIVAFAVSLNETAETAD